MIKNGTIKQGDDDDDDFLGYLSIVGVKWKIVPSDCPISYVQKKQTNEQVACSSAKNLIIQLLLGSLHLASDLHVMASGPWDRKTIKKPPCHNDRFSMIFSFLASHESHVATSSEFSRYQQINRQSLLWTFWTDFGMRSDLREKPSWAMFQARSSPWPNTKQRISDRIGQTKKCTITHLT